MFRSTTSVKILALTGATLMTLGTFGMLRAAGPAAHAERVEAVRYDDLNLNTPVGVARLYTRINAAANHVCLPLERREPALRGKWQSCLKQAVDGAVFRVNHPELTALHSARIAPWQAASVNRKQSERPKA